MLKLFMLFVLSVISATCSLYATDDYGVVYGNTPVMYIISALTAVIVLVLYFITLSQYSKRLSRMEEPLAAAAGQIMKFLGFTLLLIIAAFIAIGMIQGDIMQFFGENVTAIIVVLAIWALFFIYTLTKQSKGGKNA